MTQLVQVELGSALSFTVLGKAETAGSKRAFVRGGRAIVTDDNPKSKPWKGLVAAAGHEAMAGRALMDGALFVRFRFFSLRPRGHYGTGRNVGSVRASAPQFPTTRPDVLKLSRAAEDALTGVCWRDDAQIITELIEKHYGEPARLEVQIDEVRA